MPNPANNRKDWEAFLRRHERDLVGGDVQVLSPGKSRVRGPVEKFTFQDDYLLVVTTAWASINEQPDGKISDGRWTTLLRPRARRLEIDLRVFDGEPLTPVPAWDPNAKVWTMKAGLELVTFYTRTGEKLDQQS